jgi:predicted type IV restriction endonuclease
MVQTLKANKITLADLKDQFGLVPTRDPQFFPEWNQATEEISPEEVQALMRVQSNFENLIQEPPLLEGAIKMVVVSRLLDLAGFYQPPFRIKTETEIKTSIPDREEEGVTIRGAIDVLVVFGRLWILVIESKANNLSLTTAFAQAVSYMLSSTNPISFGLITNGSEFIFLKLNQEGTP